MNDAQFKKMLNQQMMNQSISTQTYALTGAAYAQIPWADPPFEYTPDPHGMEVKGCIYKAYEAIHKYENFYGGTNRRSELNDRLDQVKEWMIQQWPDIRTSSYGSSGWSSSGWASTLGGILPSASISPTASISPAPSTSIQEAYVGKYKQDSKGWSRILSDLGRGLVGSLGLYK